MQILTETYDWGAYFGAIAILIVISVYTIFSLLFALSKDSLVIGIFSFAGVLTCFIACLLILISDPDKIYKATITDFNEVYRNGYEIVDREGDMFILRKMDEEE